MPILYLGNAIINNEHREGDELFKRKALPALYTSILLTIGLEVFSLSLIEDYEDYTDALSEAIISAPFILFYALIGNFVYGLLVSLFAEYITKSMEGRKQLLFSFSIHVFFGFITIFFLDRLGISAIISSIIFFLIDVRLKNK
jgi:hypothetical protein